MNLIQYFEMKEYFLKSKNVLSPHSSKCNVPFIINQALRIILLIECETILNSYTVHICNINIRYNINIYRSQCTKNIKIIICGLVKGLGHSRGRQK